MPARPAERARRSLNEGWTPGFDLHSEQPPRLPDGLWPGRLTVPVVVGKDPTGPGSTTSAPRK